jgi:hypothetical protein
MTPLTTPALTPNLVVTATPPKIPASTGRPGRVLATLRRTVERLMALGGEPPPGVADAVIQRLRGEH